MKHFNIDNLDDFDISVLEKHFNKNAIKEVAKIISPSHQCIFYNCKRFHKLVDEGFPDYYICEDGFVYKMDEFGGLDQIHRTKSHQGYYATYCVNTFLTNHRLVSHYFLDVKEQQRVYFIDGNKFNPSLDNLTTKKPITYKYKSSNKKKKHILMYDLEGHILGDFLGIKEAEEKTGINKNTLLTNLNGNSKTVREKYYFKYDENLS